MTVGQLKSELEDYDEDLPIYLSSDNDYTFGGLNYIYDDEDE